jgi:hypothetical protein
VAQFERYRKESGYQCQLHEILSLTELEQILVYYFTQAKKKDGMDYSVASIRSAINAFTRHLNEKSNLKPVDLLDRYKFPQLHKLLEGKVRYLSEKGLGETKGSKGLNLEEIRKILNHSSTFIGHPWGLLKRVFFCNAIFLGLRGGKHYTLKASDFIKQNGNFEVVIYKSKTNQRGLNSFSNCEKICLPQNEEIIQLYEFYLSKRPLESSANFYLQPLEDLKGMYVYIFFILLLLLLIIFIYYRSKTRRNLV